MRKFIFLNTEIILIMIFLISGCAKSTWNKGTINKQNIDVKNNGNIAMKVHEVAVNRKNIDFYTYRSGSSSVSEEFVIYKYNENFIFAIRYFNCGDEFIESYALTKEQEEKFIDALNKCTIGIVQSTNSVVDGGSDTKNGASIKGEYYSVKGFNIEPIGIEVKDIYDVDFPKDTFKENCVFDSDEINKIIKNVSRMKQVPIFMSTLGFERLVYDQVTKEIRENIASIRVAEENENDISMNIITEDGKEYKATVTYMGYVASIDNEIKSK